jgi:hypothetical protein
MAERNGQEVRSRLALAFRAQRGRRLFRLIGCQLQDDRLPACPARESSKMHFTLDSDNKD